MKPIDETPTGLRIRPARRKDLLEIYRLETRCFPSPWPFQAFDRHLDAPAFLVGIVDGDLAGFLVADVSPGFPGPQAHLKDLAVAPPYRRQGVAKALLRQALARLSAAGAVQITLEVRLNNEPAQALYREAGFSVRHTREDYYEDGTDALVMSRSLS